MTISDNMKDYFKKLKIKFENEQDTLMLISNIQETRTLNYETYMKIVSMQEDDFLKDSIVSYSSDTLKNNDYYKNIKMPNKMENNIMLVNGNILPRLKVHWYKETSFDIDTMQIKPSNFTCYSDLDCPALFDRNTHQCWMSVEPGEINSFEKAIKEAKGNVLLFGLGLGYAAYMMSQKEDVDSVTVVENNEDIINLFNKYLLPQFSNKDKVKTVYSDAFTYMQETDLNQFDYVNLDIWMATDDMLPIYLKSLVYDLNYPNVKFSYWLEDELKSQIQRSIVRVAVNLDSDKNIYDNVARYMLSGEKVDSEDKFKEILKLENFREKMLDFHMASSESFADELTKLYEMLDFLDMYDL